MNRREFIKQAVTTTVLFSVASLGLAELLVKAKTPVGTQGSTILQVPQVPATTTIPTTTSAPPTTTSDPGNQTTGSGGSAGGSSGGTTTGSGGTTSGSGGTGTGSGGTGGTSGGGSGGSGGTSGGSGGTGGTGGTSGGTGGTGGSGGAPQPPAGYIFLAAVSAVTGSSAYFNHPSGGSCILVDYSGTWRAFSAICTHAGCVCNFTGSALYCPCHGASFSATNGAVNSGPTRTPLAEYDIQIVNGNFYVSPSRIN